MTTHSRSNHGDEALLQEMIDELKEAHAKLEKRLAEAEGLLMRLELGGLNAADVRAFLTPPASPGAAGSEGEGS